MKLNKLYIAILLFAGILTSCKVGKSYVRPELHLPDSLAQHQDTVSFGDQDWEEIYTDSTLRNLIDRALEHNKDMLIAAARIKEMAAQKRISTAALLPDIKGEVTVERELENHGGDAFRKSDTFEAQFLVSWELDLWGNLRWARSASIAEYLQSIEAQRALRMTIVAEVAQAYYELVALDTELNIVKQTLKAREEGVCRHTGLICLPHLLSAEERAPILPTQQKIFRCRNAKFFLCVLGLRYPIFRLIITDRSLP